MNKKTANTIASFILFLGLFCVLAKFAIYVAVVVAFVAAFRIIKSLR